MTIETHFESAKQCQNLFGLNEAATTVGFGIVNNWLWANLHFWDFGHFGRSARVLVLSGLLLTTLK